MIVMDKNSVVKKILTTASDGKKYKTNFYKVMLKNVGSEKSRK